jgi:hypothetical protein
MPAPHPPATEPQEAQSSQTEPTRHSKATVVSMVVLAEISATLLHEGVGHGVTAWLRGAVPTELTSNHLSTLYPDKWVDAGGTLVNLAAGALALGAMRWMASRRAADRANLRYFLWLLAAKNLFAGAGYFMFSGIGGFGDWQQVIDGLPHQALWRTGMTLFGAVLYFLVALLLAFAVRPFCFERGLYNTVGRLPYVAASVFSCMAGLLDPLGVKLLLVSTIPPAFGGSSGMLWLDSLMPRSKVDQPLVVRRAPGWWIAAAVLGAAYLWFLGRGIRLGP